MTCIRCGEPATSQLVFDPDIAPIRVCELCCENVRIGLCMVPKGEDDEKLRNWLIYGPKRKKPQKVAS